ncbi:cupredoxin domain-containing protein [Paenibacillus pasadenensis]|uniref:cupredoxin domain-containing protein n=1 Tax=Paenibacillus pasadenensis TaxID=217090 RepID=UPI00203E3ED1|nr:cupredoxin domain-containing protein [Paenibacillus pasadenensis]MCM3748299.1 cupredoxin domain-containing protein [Paenibacillus pasadenensis]
MRAIIITKRQLRVTGLAVAIAVLAFACWQLYPWNASEAPVSAALQQPDGGHVYEMVTGEFSSTTRGGEELEVYQWSPSSLTVPKGVKVTLRITGVNGESHPFTIKGLGVNGEVKKGETTEVSFTAAKAGTYPIECQIHTDLKHNGPMVGYITVH